MTPPHMSSRRRETLQDFTLALARHGQRPAVVAIDAEGRSNALSYAQLVGAAGIFAERLMRDGIGAGTPVVLLAPTRPAWIVARLALMLLGALAVPLDDLMTDADLSQALGDSGARHVLTTSDCRQRLRSLDGAQVIVLIDDIVDLAVETSEAARDAARKARGPQHGAWPPIEPESPVALFYTSGTTGPPKGVPLTHHNILANLDVLCRERLIGGEDRVLLPLPLHHSYPFLVGMLLPLAMGASIVLPSGIGGTEIVTALRAGGATAMLGVPRLYEALIAGIESRVGGRVSRGLFRAILAVAIWVLRHWHIGLGRILFRRLHSALAPSLRLMGCGGAWLDPDIEWRLRGLGWQVLTGYGLVETTSIATFNLPGRVRVGSAGRAVPGVEIKLDKPDQGGCGEVLIRGPGLFAGYRNNPEATRAAFTTDGWFRSGDLGRLDSDGYLYIVGRVKELIVLSDGKNISPENLESHYAASPFIREIAILERKGALVALVQPELQAIRAAGSSRIDHVIRVALAEASQVLPPFQRISGYAVVREPLPRTRLGKFKRHALGAIYERASAGAADAPSGAPPVQVSLDSPLGRAVWAWLEARFPGRPLAPDTVLQLDLGIDSLAWIDLGLALESRFGVALAEDAFARIVTLGELIREVEAAGKTGAAGETAKVSFAALEERWLSLPGRATRILGAALYGLNWLAMRALFRFRSAGRDQVPDDAQIVLVSNHQSDIDAFVLSAALPWRAVRRLAWGGDVSRLFQSAGRRLLARATGVFPVDDRAAERSVALARAALARGRSLVWFPEGWRSPDGRLQAFLPGVGLILRDFHGPVVPVLIQGAFEALPRGRRVPRSVPIHVRFGAPVALDALPAAVRADAGRLAGVLRDSVAALERAAPGDDARSP